MDEVAYAMTAKELIKAGRLAEARSVLVEEVKKRPADTGARTLLFQVLALLGEWDKAERHLDMISTQDPSRIVGVKAFIDLTRAERERISVVRGEATPSVMPSAPSYFEAYLAYLDALNRGDHPRARELLEAVEEARPVVSGTINGTVFEGISETDARLYAFFEVIVHDRYVWVPFEAIRELVFEEPASSFDLIWARANLVTWEGLGASCLVPVTYPETSTLGDDAARLGRLTDWRAMGGGFFQGVGQHVYQAGERDVPLLEIRTVEFAYGSA